MTKETFKGKWVASKSKRSEALRLLRTSSMTQYEFVVAMGKLYPSKGAASCAVTALKKAGLLEMRVHLTQKGRDIITDLEERNGTC